jgi:hypothetical protein
MILAHRDKETGTDMKPGKKVEELRDTLPHTAEGVHIDL